MNPRNFLIPASLLTPGLHILRPLVVAIARGEFRTANSGAQDEMQLSALVSGNAANIAGLSNGEWGLIAPFGVHPSPDGSYVQKFDQAQAEKVVRTWNSITGTAARCFKNVMHGLGTKLTCPIWEGHPDSDKLRWPKEKLLGEITNLRVGTEGLEGCVTWNAKGLQDRMRGQLYPSALWWHWPASGVPLTVYPELLESVGLWPTPNIPGVPAWTQNAIPNLASQSEADPQKKPTQTENIVNREKLLKLLGLAADATDEQIDAALKGISTTANALSTANAAKADLETQLSTANAALQTANTSVQTLTGERDQLQTANAALTTANGILVKGVLDLAEKCGAFTPAERAGFETRITTANTAADALAELQTRKAMNVQSVEINGNRVDLSTANARADALETAIAAKMKESNLTRDEAFSKCQADPNLAGLFGAMADPTKKAA
jgi:phage I-like protein